MPFKLVVAMNVTDSMGYADYRAAMGPILEHFGGRFEFDMIVARVLTSAAPHPITRVFTLVFPTRAASVAFFADHAYAAAKARHFVRSVNGFTILAEVDDEPSPR